MRPSRWRPTCRSTSPTRARRGSAPPNENTNGLIREHLPKGTHITDHQPYLTTITEELNERPRAILGYLTPREAFEELLVASTP